MSHQELHIIVSITPASGVMTSEKLNLFLEVGNAAARSFERKVFSNPFFGIKGTVMAVRETADVGKQRIVLLRNSVDHAADGDAASKNISIELAIDEEQ